MSSFVSLQGSGAPAAAPNGPSSGQMSEKPPPVPWQQLASTFKTTSEAKSGTVPLIVANTTLEQDKETVLRCWLAMGGKEDVLRRRYWNEDYDYDYGYEDEEECLMRDEPSDDVSEWWGVTVEGGRVTKLDWEYINPLSVVEKDRVIPAEIGALSALTHLVLRNNRLHGAIPPTIGALSSLTYLVPYSFSNLLNLEELHLGGNFLSDNPGDLDGKREVQEYLSSLFRHPAIRLLNYGIAITKKRQNILSTTTTTSSAPPTSPLHPFFEFLATHEHTLTDLIMSFFDPVYCCNKDRTTLLKCWTSLGEAEDKLRRGYGDDVARWKGVMVEDGRVVKVEWGRMDLKGNLPSEIGELDGLRELNLYINKISSIPSEIDKLTSLTKLHLGVNHLEDLPRELGNLRSLARLDLHMNRLSVLPSNLANLTNLDTLYLVGNNFTIDFSNIYNNKEQIQTFLATLKSTDQN